MSDGPRTVRRELPVKGRENTRVTVVVTVYRDMVWLQVAAPFESDITILEPPMVDRLIEILTWAAHQARGYTAGGV